MESPHLNFRGSPNVGWLFKLDQKISLDVKITVLIINLFSLQNIFLRNLIVKDTGI